jgi:hypothetical protein
VRAAPKGQSPPAALQKAFDSGKLQFFTALEFLREPEAFAELLNRMKAGEWVVYAKRPFAGPKQVLDYVGRYTHRVAISNSRLLDIENARVRFQYASLNRRCSRMMKRLLEHRALAAQSQPQAQ